MAKDSGDSSPRAAFDANHPQPSPNWWLIDYCHDRGATLGELAYVHKVPIDMLRERYQKKDRPRSRYLAWIRGQECCLFGCQRLGEPHHALPRGAGGADKDTVPMCHEHHMECHKIGHITFEKKYEISLHLVAAVLHEAWKKPKPPVDGM